MMAMAQIAVMSESIIGMAPPGPNEVLTLMGRPLVIGQVGLFPSLMMATPLPLEHL